MPLNIHYHNFSRAGALVSYWVYLGIYTVTVTIFFISQSKASPKLCARVRVADGQCTWSKLTFSAQSCWVCLSFVSLTTTLIKMSLKMFLVLCFALLSSSSWFSQLTMVIFDTEFVSGFGWNCSVHCTFWILYAISGLNLGVIFFLLTFFQHHSISNGLSLYILVFVFVFGYCSHSCYQVTGHEDEESRTTCAADDMCSE